MSPVSDFDDAYVGSRDRLLLQLYAFCGDAPAADAALTEAFIAASRSWRRLGPLGPVDRWVRDRAVRRLAGRKGVPPRGAAAASASPSPRSPSPRSAANAVLLAALAALDPATRRLLILRRLADTPLAAAASEVGLGEGAAEQALARATSALHGRGVDTTPASLQASLERLGDDLRELPAAPPERLRRTGARRRYLLIGVAAVTTVSVIGSAVAYAASRPDTAGSGKAAQTTNPTATAPTFTTPTSPGSSATSTPAPPAVDGGDLLSAPQVSRVHRGTGWRVAASSALPPLESVYGDCVEAADDPPPRLTWTRDFATGAIPVRSRLRQVLQLAPSDVEAVRSYRQILAALTHCAGHQLVAYFRVDSLGDRTHLVQLLEPRTGGAGTENVLVAQSGSVVTVLAVTSPGGQTAALTPDQLARLAGTAVDRICSAAGGDCAAPPYRIGSLRPPPDATAQGLLSVVDLPLVPKVAEPWVATDPTEVAGNPSGTACDRADLAGDGAKRVRTRSYVIPHAPEVPTLFGLTETRGSFSSRGAAQGFVAAVARAVETCHRREPTLSVPHTLTLSTGGVSGWVWQVRQRVSKTKVVTFRVALVRSGNTVAEVTLTPAGAYDVGPAAFTALARRAAVRLGE